MTERQPASEDIIAGRRGVYNNDYFSGAQVALYVGDVWVDEVTSISYARHQSRTPLYGYASRRFDAVSEGQILVQGEFSINFKEAGYLWLVLNRYQSLVAGGRNKLVPIKKDHPLFTAEYAQSRSIEQIVSDKPRVSQLRKNLDKAKLAEAMAQEVVAARHASLTGFSSRERALGSGDELLKGIGIAESAFERFENLVWNDGRQGTEQVGGFTVDTSNRQADDPELNPFDIYVAYGDYSGDDRIHHTIQKIQDVHLLGNSKQVVIDGQPIQEVYSFIAYDLI